jgi:hypothetical protein
VAVAAATVVALVVAAAAVVVVTAVAAAATDFLALCHKIKEGLYGPFLLPLFCVPCAPTTWVAITASPALTFELMG